MLPTKMFMDKEKQNTMSGTQKHSTEDKFDVFLQEDEIGVNDNPLSWWQLHSDVYPGVCQLGRTWLAAPTSSMSSQRMCSTSGHVVEKPHCSLTPQRINILVFFNRNWYLL